MALIFMYRRISYRLIVIRNVMGINDNAVCNKSGLMQPAHAVFVLPVADGKQL